MEIEREPVGGRETQREGDGGRGESQREEERGRKRVRYIEGKRVRDGEIEGDTRCAREKRGATLKKVSLLPTS